VDFERLAVPLTPPAPPVAPAGRVLDLMAASDLIMQPGHLMRLTATTPFDSASAYIDPLIWNSRRAHNALPLLVAQLAVKAGVPYPDAADWTSELVPAPAGDVRRPEAAPPPATAAPQSRPVFAPLDVKVGQTVRLEGVTPDGRAAATTVPPTLWNLGQEDHYAEARRTVLWMLGISPDEPAHADAAAVVWNATVVEADPEPAPSARPAAPSPAPGIPAVPVAPDRAQGAETGPSELTGIYDMRHVFDDAPAMIGGSERR